MLKFLQARDPSWVQRPLFAQYDSHATSMNQLRPAFNERESFFEPALRETLNHEQERPGQSSPVGLDVVVDDDNRGMVSGFGAPSKFGKDQR